MKKVSLIVAAIALCGLAASTFADVQNIRLSGDIRVRGYLSDAAGKDNIAPNKQTRNDVQFVTQRTRVTVEADLEDHVTAVVTLQANGIWGDPASRKAGANGTSRTFAVGVSEAYVQLRELFYSPATLKIGRQSLNYGTGLIISSADQMYTFDAGRLVLDYHPLTIDIVGAQLDNSQTFSPNTTAAPLGGQSDMLFLNAKYEVNSVVKNVEAYFGWVSQSGTNQAFGNQPLGVACPSPMILGLRTDLTPIENLTASLEGAYELGNSSSVAGLADKNISAYLLKAEAKYVLKGVAWTPTFNASYTYASGDSDLIAPGAAASTRHYFLPWFNMADGNNGYVLAPLLSNIQIINLGASVKPCANTTLALQGYYYLKANKNGSCLQNISDPRANLGGFGFTTANSDSRDIGAEIDAIIGYDYSKDVRCQLVYAAFLPENAYEGVASRIVNQVRGEINVKF